MASYYFALLSLVVLLGSDVCVWAQSPSTAENLKPRELFYTPPPSRTPAPAPAPVPSSGRRSRTRRPEQPASEPVPVPVSTISTPLPLVLRYSVLRRDAGNSSFEEMSPDTLFHTGDVIKLRIEANDRSYLYVIAQGTSGSWDVMFPRPDQGQADNLIERGQVYEVPSRQPWILEAPSGVERLFLLLTRQPDQELERVIRMLYPREGERSNTVASNGIKQEQIDALQERVQARDLVFEKGDESDRTGRKDPALYIMTKVKGNPAAITARINLMH